MSFRKRKGEGLKKLKMRKDDNNGGDTLEELQRRLDNLKEKKPPAIRVMSFRKRKGEEGTSTDQVTDAKRMIRQYTADDLINDVIKEVEREKEENEGSQEAGFNEDFAGMDDESSRLIRKIMEEQRLEEMCGETSKDSPPISSSSETSSIVTSSSDEDDDYY